MTIYKLALLRLNAQYRNDIKLRRLIVRNPELSLDNISATLYLSNYPNNFVSMCYALRTW
jgi:hypothetical protein